MGHQKFAALVIEHCLCDGCKKKFKKLKKKIPQVHSVECNIEERKATIFGAVDAATVMEELAKKCITPKILWGESSPIYQHPQKQTVLPKPSVPKIHNHVGVKPHHPAVDPAKVTGELEKKDNVREFMLEESSRIDSQRQRQHQHQHQEKQIVLPKPSVRKIHNHVRIVPHDPAESAGPRIQDESIVKKTPDHYLHHEHELELVKGSNKRFSCDGCKEDGFGSRYRCECCNFDLHHECRFPERTISPEIRKGLIFEFRPQKPPKERICDACGRDIHGCFYQCRAKGMDLHPCCSKLKAQVSNDGMVLLLREKVSSQCSWCREKVPPGTKRRIAGWFYVSECKRYTIHIHCITQMLHQAWQRGLMDHTDESSIETVPCKHMTVSNRKHGQRGTKVPLKIFIDILRAVVGVLLGDPSVLFCSLMVEFLKDCLQNK